MCQNNVCLLLMWLLSHLESQNHRTTSKIIESKFKAKAVASIMSIFISQNTPSRWISPLSYWLSPLFLSSANFHFNHFIAGASEYSQAPGCLRQKKGAYSEPLIGDIQYDPNGGSVLEGLCLCKSV